MYEVVYVVDAMADANCVIVDIPDRDTTMMVKDRLNEGLCPDNVSRWYWAHANSVPRKPLCVVIPYTPELFKIV